MNEQKIGRDNLPPRYPLDAVVLEALGRGYWSERELCQVLDEHRRGVSNALNRLMTWGYVTTVRPPTWGVILYALAGSR